MKATSLADRNGPEKNNVEAARGHLRAQSEQVDVAILREPVTFAFSGRTAKNRLLKAPMTERLCYWSKEGEDIVRILIVWSSISIEHELVRQRRT
jgi:hypothetical protein